MEVLIAIILTALTITGVLMLMVGFICLLPTPQESWERIQDRLQKDFEKKMGIEKD